MTAASATPTVGDRSVPAGLLTAATAAAGLVVLYLLAVTTELGQRVDQAAMEGVAATAAGDWAADDRAAGDWAAAVTNLVSPATVLLAALVVVVVAGATRGVVPAVAGLLAAAGTVVGSQLLKASLERPDLLADGAANSFPSGHVAAVAGVAAALLIAVPPRLRGPVGWLVAAPVVVVTGTATVALEWHRPSDVLGSVLLAVALGALGAAVSGRSAGRSWS